MIPQCCVLRADKMTVDYTKRDFSTISVHVGADRESVMKDDHGKRRDGVFLSFLEYFLEVFFFFLPSPSEEMQRPGVGWRVFCFFFWKWFWVGAVISTATLSSPCGPFYAAAARASPGFLSVPPFHPLPAPPHLMEQ